MAKTTKSRMAPSAEADLLIGELEIKFDLMRLRNLKAGLEREEERLAEEERVWSDRLRPTDAATVSSMLPADGVRKGGWWRVLAGKIAIWHRVWWIRIRRGMLVERWRQLSLLEDEVEFAMRERGLQMPR
jgi:hypothetical protein